MAASAITTTSEGLQQALVTLALFYPKPEEFAPIKAAAESAEPEVLLKALLPSLVRVPSPVKQLLEEQLLSPVEDRIFRYLEELRGKIPTTSPEDLQILDQIKAFIQDENCTEDFPPIDVLIEHYPDEDFLLHVAGYMASLLQEEL